MVVMDIISHPAPAQPVGRQLAVWLAPFPAKRLARMFNVEPRTAKSWRAGDLPQNRHLLAMIGAWGRPFIDHLFAPVLAPDPADLAGRLARVQVEISEIRRVMDGGGVRPVDDLAPFVG